MSMSQLALASVFCVLLSGCLATMKANIKNESENKVFVIKPHKSNTAWLIDSGSTVQVTWYPNCIGIVDGDDTMYFSGIPIPDKVVDVNVINSTLDAVYKDKTLYFVTANNQRVNSVRSGKCF